jgi:5-methyltetrahydrofolate--homocysteine methyltransferase
MNSMLEQLLAHAPVVTDGAIGTELQARGLDNGECPDVWNLARPAEVEALTRAYVEAGSDIVLTNTFRSNPLALARHRRAEQAEEFNLAGVEIARRATAGRARIFGCIGPSGKILMMGETSEVELRGAFSAQVRTLAAAGVEGLAIETMAELDEARVALAAALETGLPVMVSMVFDSTDRPIWIKPNAGMPELVDGKAIYRTTPEEFAAFVPAVLQAGVSFIGGCCGTNPEFIRATAETARRWRRR